MLGSREVKLYGKQTLDDLKDRLLSREYNVDFDFYQSNSEKDIVEKIHTHKLEPYDYGIFNFGAHTHTSIAIRDAILSVQIKFFEVHISNVYAREDFRHKSYFLSLIHI